VGKKTERGVFLTKQYFPKVQKEERKELVTGLIAVGANSSLELRGERGLQTNRAGDTLPIRASKPNKKITAALRLLPERSLLI
jgi:hypothetical protein